MNMHLSPLFFIPLVSACTTGPIAKASLDAEVNRLCKIDGGVKIYENIKLNKDKFSERNDFINFYRPTKGEDALGADYLFKYDVFYYIKGNPELSRKKYQIFRRSDGKLLGETIIYGRGGGDLPGPWYDSGFTCPPFSEAGVNVLIKLLFIKAN